MPQPRIPVSAIDEVLRAVEEAPHLHEMEVPKVEAMRRLIPALRTLQAKGYGLAQIARLLSERGIAVTEVTLKHYMHRLGARNAVETPAPPKRDRTLQRTATVPPPKHAPTRTPTTGNAFPEKATAQRPSTDAAATTASRTSPLGPTAPSESPRRDTAAPATELLTGRGGFVVRPDRTNI